MTRSRSPLPGDQARVTVRLAVPPNVAFRVFTEEIDQWWRRGQKYRVSAGQHGVLRLEPGVGGRLFETLESAAGTRICEMGRVTAWDPPNRLEFEWRAANFAPDESTTVEVVFEPSSSGTLVTVTHRGWSRIRPDHPVRHGQDVVAFVRENGLWWGELVSSYRELAERRNLPPSTIR